MAQGDREGAIGAYRRAIQLDPKYAGAHNNLGNALKDQGNLDGAIGCYRRAIALDPKDPKARNNLGNALQGKGNLDGAVAQYRRAIALDPKYGRAHYNLGNALAAKGDRDGAIVEYQKAIALEPKHAKAHNNLGNALKDNGDLGGAIAAYRRAIALDAKYAKPHYNLGLVLHAQGDVDGAVAGYRRAIELDPKCANAHAALGQALLRQRHFTEGCNATRRALGLLPPKDPLRKLALQQLRRGEQLLQIDTKLAAALKGERQPAGATEQLDLGFLCRRYKQRYAAAARFYADAFAADPKLAEDLVNGYRYDATCAAALAAAGQGEDAAKVPDKLQARLRQQALGWLQEHLAAWKKVGEKGTAQARALVEKTLQHWQQDPDLASLRDKAALAKLPEAERQAWQKLWAEVEAVVKRAQGKE
jgi:Flp pilus assembly protein TadD